MSLLLYSFFFAFPDPDDVSAEDIRVLGRKYGSQVVEPLLSINLLEETDLMWRVASFLSDDGKYRDSEKLWQTIIQIQRHSDPEHSDMLSAIANLANTYRDQGRMGEAAALEEVLQKWSLGVEHPNTLRAMANLANTYQDQGRTGEAAALQEEVLQKWRWILGEEHPDMLRAMADLAVTYSDQGRTDEAAVLQEEVLQKCSWILGEEHPDTLTSMANLAVTDFRSGQDG